MREPARMPRWLIDAVTKEKAYIPAEVPPAELTVRNGNGGHGNYGAKALASEIEQLTASLPGERNNRLNVAAFKMAQLIAAGILQESTVLVELEQAGLSLGLPRDEVRKTIRSGINAGIREPRQIVAKNLLHSIKYKSLQERNTGTDSGANGGLLQSPSGDFATIPQSSAPADRWQPKPMSALNATKEELDWVWHGYAAPGMVTLFTGLWKSGKSTLLAYLLQSLSGDLQQFAGQQVRCGKVLVVSEESERHWVERRDNLALKDHVSVVSKPFLKNPSWADWDKFVAFVATEVLQQSYDMVVFDSIFNLWPVKDENNAAEVKAALMPMNQLTEAGAAVLLIAHPKKGDAGEGQATRGSGALPSIVDIILEFRRFDAERREDTRRVLTTYSRFDDTPPEVVVEYDPATGYTARGTRADAKMDGRHSTILEILPEDEPGSTVEEILATWPEDSPKPARRTLAYDLDFLANEMRVIRRGSGKRGDAYKYRRSHTDVSFLASSNPYRVATNELTIDEANDLAWEVAPE